MGQTRLDDNLPVPRPSEGGLSGKWVQRVPKSLHARLTRRAKAEGVSLNTLVLSMILEGFSNVWGGLRAPGPGFRANVAHGFDP